MKLLITILLLPLFAIAQHKSDIAVYGTFGSKSSSPVFGNVNGNFNGLEVSYRENHGRFYNEFQVWNADLGRLYIGSDTTTRGFMGHEYGGAFGIGYNFIQHNSFSVSVIPQVGFAIGNHIYSVGRGILRVNWRIVEMSITDAYETTPFTIHGYLNRVYVGFGFRQKWL